MDQRKKRVDRSACSGVKALSKFKGAIHGGAASPDEPPLKWDSVLAEDARLMSL